MNCPSCGGAVDLPSLDEIMIKRGICGEQVDILDLLWEAGGLPVKAETLFGAMFDGADDGGPGQNAMYRRLRQVITGLAVKLTGSGLSVVYVERRGWRLIIGELA